MGYILAGIMSVFAWECLKAKKKAKIYRSPSSCCGSGTWLNRLGNLVCKKCKRKIKGE